MFRHSVRISFVTCVHRLFLAARFVLINLSTVFKSRKKKRKKKTEKKGAPTLAPAPVAVFFYHPGPDPGPGLA